MSTVAYRDGRILPIGDVDLGILTGALHCGTVTREGVRACRDAESDGLPTLRPHGHDARLRDSARVYSMAPVESVKGILVTSGGPR